MGNIVLSNKHEQFSNEFLYGKNKGNAGRCYAEVYHNGEMTPNCYSHGSRLLTREDVSQYLEIKRDELMKVAEFRQISNVQTLTDIIEECATYKPTDINGTELSPHLVRATAIKAIETQNKMLGLNKEKTDINVNGGMTFNFNLIPPSDEDDEKIKAEMDAIRTEKGDAVEDIDYEDLDNKEEF